MKASDLRKKSKSELYSLLAELREKKKKLKIDLASAKLKNVKEISKVKKDIARILTILREMELREMDKDKNKK